MTDVPVNDDGPKPDLGRDPARVPLRQGREDKPNLSLLRERAQLLRTLRQFFDDLGFWEVQPPCLSRDCIVDAFIDPVEVSAGQLGLALDPAPASFYLQTSPELAMKRMLAAGAPSIYSLGPVFRAGEQGRQHNPEFTMLEWYEVGATMQMGIERLGQLATRMLNRDRYDVVSYRDVFSDSLGFDPIEVTLDSLQKRVAVVDAPLASSIGDDRDSLLDVLWSQSIQPTLGLARPVIVKNYPLSQAALAKQAADDPRCAARFELFAAGLELANGYDELRDVGILADRLRRNQRRRIDAGRKPLGQSQDTLLRAISDALPQCTGVALGVDRLLMARVGAEAIDRVIPFPIDFA